MAIVSGVIGLAKAFGRKVIAEGVETDAHGEKLIALGCPVAQGYGIARPMPAEQMVQWVQRWKSLATA
jgi:EAL domain-containing protein (putative c-di-GMP-specific phosphodiesterase class I)